MQRTRQFTASSTTRQTRGSSVLTATRPTRWPSRTLTTPSGEKFRKESNTFYKIFHPRDLFNSISEGDFPTWTMFLQVMTFEEAEMCEFNPFDLTKVKVNVRKQLNNVSQVWSHADFPLIPVGKLTLNRNPRNYFAEVR